MPDGHGGGQRECEERGEASRRQLSAEFSFLAVTPGT